jgi:phage protein D
LQFLQMLAKRNGFVFYVDPDTFDSTKVYWGIENRKDTPQPALSMNMGSNTNVTTLTFANNSLTPVNVKGSFIDPASKQVNPVSPPSSNLQPLAATTSKNMRTILLRNSGQRESSQATLAASALMSDNTKSVTGNGQLDTINYGYILRAGELVGVRGMGASYNGNYYVRQVKHTIERGTYTQSFTLSREGTGALKDKVQ